LIAEYNTNKLIYQCPKYKKDIKIIQQITDVDLSMRYIYFVLIALVLSGFASTTVSAQESGVMIHYCKDSLDIGDTYSLEQGYSFKVRDINDGTGNSWIELYFNGEKVDTHDQFSKENDPFEYRKTVTENGDEKQHLIIRITPVELIKTSNDVSVKYKIEQYLDPEIKTDNYLIIDDTESVNNINPLELENNYTFHVGYFGQESAVLTLKKDGSTVKETETNVGDYFAYTKKTSTGSTTIFLAKLSELFTSKDYNTVFLENIILRKDYNFDSGPGIDSDITLNTKIKDLDGDGLTSGDKAIVSYTLKNGNFSEVEVELDGKQIDFRNDVDSGTYVALTGNLTGGVHNTTITAVSEEGVNKKQTIEFVVKSTSDNSNELSLNLSDNSSKMGNKLKNLAGSVFDKLTTNNSEINSSINSEGSNSVGISENSGLITALSAVITVVVFSILAFFILNLLR
jgi:hypothetical protein